MKGLLTAMAIGLIAAGCANSEKPKEEKLSDTVAHETKEIKPVDTVGKDTVDYGERDKETMKNILEGL